jgi:DNA-binding MarR family transcriptional regulator
LTRPASQTDGPAVEALLTILRICRVLERIDAGVSPQQYRMLKLIGEGGERSARLADRLAVARPTLTATADSLVAAGLAYREAEPGDRRVVRLRLTEAGQATVARADVAYAEWFGGLLDHTGQREQIVADLLQLDAAMTERRRARAIAAADTASAAPDTAARAQDTVAPDTTIVAPGTAAPGTAAPDTAAPDTASTESAPEPLAVTQR